MSPPPDGRDEDRTSALDFDVEGQRTAAMSGSGPGQELLTFASGDTVAGRYTIMRFVARGGMGEVYEAADLELGTRVALKTIRAEIALNDRALDRFKREILLARMVTHPNVCRIFDLGRHEFPPRDDQPRLPVTFLTMELLEGETLAHRVATTGRFTTKEAWPLVLQMGEALAAAHRVGVVHRDFKSGNVMLVASPDNAPLRAVVTDFGLARSSADTSPAVSTASGFVLGTPAYIAPEQVEGEEVTGAADQYALGVVMYEMVTGSTPFTGDTPLAVVVKRLKAPAPSPRAQVPDIDPRWEEVILRCLERDPRARFASIDELLTALRGDYTQPLLRPVPSAHVGASVPLSAVPEARPPGAPPAGSRIRRNAIYAALLAGVAIAALFFRPRAEPPAERPLLGGGATQVTSSSGLDLHPSFAPDGRTLAYSSNRTGGFEIRLAQVGTGAGDVALTSDGHQNVQPVVSPDGRTIAYHAQARGGIWVIPTAGGVVRQVSAFGSRPAWSPAGDRLAFQSEALVDLAPNAVGAMPPSTLWVVPLAGGAPRPVTTGGSPAGGHGAPSWSRDGLRLVFTASDRRGSSLWSVSLDGSELFRLVPEHIYTYDPVHAPDGRRLYYAAVADSGQYGVWGLPMGEDGRASGPPARLADLGLGATRHLTVSPDGKRIAFSALHMISNLRQAAASAGAARLPPLTAETGRNSRPSFSPRGDWIAFERWRQGQNSDVWLMRPDGSEVAQVTSDPAVDTVPTWFPDGRRLLFRSDRLGRSALWQYDLLARRESLLLEPPQDMDWVRLSPDGTTIAFNSTRGGGPVNVWTSKLDGGALRQLTYDSEFMGFPSWSPDGRHLAVQLKRGEDAQVAIVPREGGNPTVLTRTAGQAWPYSFAPDGTAIAFAGLRDGFWNVYSVSVATGEERRHTSFEQLSAYVRYPAWAPRGDRIVYEYAETSGNVWMVELAR